MPAKDGKRRLRGFACMSQDKVKEIARLGGLSVPKEKRSFSQNRALAATAGAAGGAALKDEDRAFFKDRDLAASAGRAAHRRRPAATTGDDS